jgi:hypothetical protein
MTSVSSTHGIGDGANQDRRHAPLPQSAPEYTTTFFLFIDSKVLDFSRFAIEPRVSSRVTLPLFPVLCSGVVLSRRCP